MARSAKIYKTIKKELPKRLTVAAPPAQAVEIDTATERKYTIRLQTRMREDLLDRL